MVKLHLTDSCGIMQASATGMFIMLIWIICRIKTFEAFHVI